jgi:hypothetical protein
VKAAGEAGAFVVTTDVLVLSSSSIVLATEVLVMSSSSSSTVFATEVLVLASSIVLATDVLVLVSPSSTALTTEVVSALTRANGVGAAALTVTELLVASSPVVVDTTLLLDDELDELELACSISPESWLAAAKPAAPNANPATAAATTAIRFPIRSLANIATSWCAYVVIDTTHGAARLGRSIDALGDLAVLVPDLDA